MTNLQLWSLLVGFVLPPIQAIVQQSRWSPHVRAVVNFLICAVVALGVVYFEGTVDFHDWIRAFLLVFVSAATTYQGLWKPTKIAPAIESKTNL